MSDHSPMEMKAHEGTYESFLALLKFGTVGCLIVTFVVVYLISH